MRHVDVAVIGAGQAGLSAAYHLQRRGFVPHIRAAAGDRTFIVLDAEEAPGGAWQHRWESLKMATVNGIHELPGFPVPPADSEASSRDVLPAYFAAYETQFQLDVQRPVKVSGVLKHPDGRLLVKSEPLGSRRQTPGEWTCGAQCLKASNTTERGCQREPSNEPT